MIDKLKFMIDATEDNPRLKALFLKVAEMPEDKQESMLKIIEILAKNREL